MADIEMIEGFPDVDDYCRLRVTAGMSPRTARKERAPFVLLHDSLGCVAWWRDFPKASQTTGRDVIVFD